LALSLARHLSERVYDELSTLENSDDSWIEQRGFFGVALWTEYAIIFSKDHARGRGYRISQHLSEGVWIEVLLFDQLKCFFVILISEF
jgi:hypothetical protein